ncbi:M1 family aminopeptidase [Microbacterium sp. P04]|uniref:M1 family aminopeptidase n=1 Tax=Microbacterium sp. P04 TaxID=3366947 RepID=UPI0037470BF8
MVAFTLPALLAAGIVAGSALPAQAADPIDGAQTSGDAMFPNVGNGGYDALDYTVNIAWTPDAAQAGSTIAGSIVATSTMTATAPQPLKTFSLDFEGLQIDTITVNGVPATWRRDIDPAAIKYKLVIAPATPVTGEFTTVITYHGVPESHTDADGSSEGWNATSDGATMLGQPIGNMTGYPHNNTPGDKATYTFSVDIPTTLNNVAGTAPSAGAAVSNGELTSRTPSADGTRTTWVWKQSEQMASELAMISIGRYDIIEGQVALSDGRTIPSWSFMDSALSPTNKATITTRTGQLGTIIRNLETLYGPYPGNSTGVVIDTVPGGISYALETQDRSFFPSTGSVNGNTLIHELAHQWYGDNVSPVTWTDIWINEGMATWGPTFYNSPEGFGTSANTTETSYFNSWNSRGPTDPVWEIAPGRQTDSAALYDYQTYTRGAQFWEALRIAIGDDAFFATLKEWQVRYAGQSKTGADLKALAQELSGRDLTAFYQDWILDADKPAWPEELTLALTSQPTDGPLARGGSITYTLTATNTGLVPLATSVATVDVADVLADATIDSATLPAGVTLTGTTLRWAIPATPVGTTPASVAFSARVTNAASGGTIDAAATVETLGGTCDACESSLAVTEYPLDTATPVISGTPEVGAVLTALTNGWPADTTFTYAWAVDGVAVPGADEVTFTVPVTSLGSRISVSVTGSKPGYLPASATSGEVGPVVLAAVASPSPTPTPTGTPTGVPAADPTRAPSDLAGTGGSMPIEASLWAIGLVALGAVGTAIAVRRRSRTS